MTDLTASYWEAVLGAARGVGWPEVSSINSLVQRWGHTAVCRASRRSPPRSFPLQDQLTKLRQRQILRTLAAKTPFTKAALEVVRRRWPAPASPLPSCAVPTPFPALLSLPPASCYRPWAGSQRGRTARLLARPPARQRSCRQAERDRTRPNRGRGATEGVLQGKPAGMASASMQLQTSAPKLYICEFAAVSQACRRFQRGLVGMLAVDSSGCQWLLQASSSALAPAHLPLRPEPQTHQVGAYVRSCAANIDKLQEMLAAGGGGSPAKGPPSADAAAHRQACGHAAARAAAAAAADRCRERGAAVRVDGDE